MKSAIILLCLFMVPGAFAAENVNSVLEKLFGGKAKLTKVRAYLSNAELSEINRTLEKPAQFESGLVTYWQVRRAKDTVFAYLDTHRVRTMPETLLIAIDEKARIQKIEVMRFDEPPEYKASLPYVEQYYDHELADQSTKMSSIQGITGATLTDRSFRRAIARALALHRYLLQNSAK